MKKMQVFLLDYDPRRAAACLCDVHVIKMPLETMQIIETHLALHGCEHLYAPYQPGGRFRRACENPAVFQWMLRYAVALRGEHRYRFHTDAPGRIPQIMDSSRFHELFVPDPPMPLPGDFAMSFGKWHTEVSDPVAAYREYYRYKKSVFKKPWRYTGREEPIWLR